MSWWPFNEDANNGKTSEQLDAERAQLARQRAQRQAQRAAEAEAAQDYAAAEAIREAQDEWERQHAQNLQRQAAAEEYTVTDAFSDGWDEGAANVRGAVGGAVRGTVGTVFSLLPWWLWLVLLGGLAFIVNQQTGGLLTSMLRRKKA